MKTKYSIASFYFICMVSMVFSLLSCNKERKTDRYEIDLAAVVASPTELLASDCFRQIEYVPLETTDSSLIGSAPHVQVTRNRIVVTTDREDCLLFDKATGRFLRKVGHRGMEPGGYKEANCLINERNGLLYFRGWRNDLVKYDLDGNFVGEVKIPSIPGSDVYPWNFQCLGGDTLVGFYSNAMTGQEVNRLLFFRENGELLHHIPNQQVCPALEILSMSVVKGEYAVERLGPFAYGIAVFLDGKDAKSIETKGSSNFWQLGEHTYFKEPFNDTIYQVEGTGLKPHQVYNLGEYGWTYADRFLKEPDTRIYISQVLDSEERMLFRYITNLYTEDKRQLYNGIFNKVTGEVTVSLFEKGIKDDITDFLPLQPLSVSRSGEYVGLIPATDVVEWFEKHTDRKEAPGKTLQPLLSVGEESNPVIVLIQ